MQVRAAHGPEELLSSVVRKGVAGHPEKQL